MHNQRRLYRVLVKHFTNRLFDTELVSRSGTLRESFTTVIALLAATSVVVAYVTVMKHWMLNIHTREVIRSAMEWSDREFLISLSMAVVAVAGVFCWQSVFPDRRDCLILSALPLRTWTMIAAKITSLGALFLVVVVSLNLVTTFFFPVATARYLTMAQVARFYGAHIVAVGFASAFVFLVVLCIQALIANVTPFRLFQRASAWIQLVCLFGALFGFFMVPAIASEGAIVLPQNRTAALMLPPFWFLGLYQTLLGTQHPFIHELAVMAIRGLVIAVAVGAVLYAIAYRRIMRRTIEDSGAVGDSGVNRWVRLEAFFDRFLLKNARERAAFHFIWRTMTRNRGHRFMLAAYASLGLVYVVSGVAGVVKKAGGGALLHPNSSLSALPLVLPFFVLLGLRALFAIPVELQANWIFRITDAGRPHEYVRAARKLMLFAGILPVCAAALPLYGVLWGWRMAFAHVAMSLLGSMAALEWMMAGFRKVPFTCPWMPGKGNLKVMFGVWVVLFLALAFMIVNIELALASSRVGSLVGIALCGLLWFHRIRKRRAEEGPDTVVMWEEPPVWHLQTLELSR